jgi:two-component sensor histidine kinase
MPERDDFLRELHHRVKNNFQIIASLMNLQKRMLPPERRGDLRFVEEHVQSMAVAYRIVSASSEMVQVPIDELVREVADNLRQIAGAKPGSLLYDMTQGGAEIELNQGIVLGLYLAVVLPPHLDHVAAQGGSVHIRTAVADGALTLSVTGEPGAPAEMDFMRRRLIDSYIRQLRGDTPAGTPEGELRLHFQLDPPRVGIARPGGGAVSGGTVQAAAR